MGNMPEIKVELGNVLAPLAKFAEVIGQGIGGVWRPLGTVLQAHADAHAAVIKAEGDVQTSEVLRRAAWRIGHVEVQRQLNLESIVEKARLALPESVSSEPVGRDWTNYFFNSCQDVSEAQMQEIWGKILAGEITEPGSTSKRALEVLKTMEKSDAETFETLLSVSFQYESSWHFIVQDEVTTRTLAKLDPKYGHTIITHLSDIGLLSGEDRIMNASKTTGLRFGYGGKKYRFVGPPEPEPTPSGILPIEMSVFMRPLTIVGQSLSRVAKCNPVANFIPELSTNLIKEMEVRIEEGDKE